MLRCIAISLCFLAQTTWAANPSAQLALAQQYEHGEGVTQNAEKAVEWYCAAARQGLAEAQQRLAWMYMNGHGVKQNDAIALRWFSQAAAQGDQYAKRMIRFLNPDAHQDQRVCAIPVADSWKRYCEQHTCEAVMAAVQRLAHDYALDPNLVLSVIMVESRFNPNAKSPKNAQGLMQLMPGTARRFGVKNAWAIEDNIRGGMTYLKWLLAYYQGDVSLAAAAYNAGEGAVDRYKGIPRYRETQHYVKKILRLYGKKTHQFEQGWVETSPMFIN